MSAVAKELPTIIPAQGNALTPMDIMREAVARGDMDAVSKLMDFQERWEKNQARKSFDTAIAAAKAEIPVIAKNRQVGFDSKKVGAARTQYRHEDFAQVARTVDPVLAKHGLSYRFRTSSNVNEPVVVTCVLSHREGHSEETTLTAGRDDTGNKNSIQAVGSTITYLQRYTLKAALGLASSSDDDAAAAEQGERITNEQVEQLRTEIVERGVNLTKFLKWAKVESLEEIEAVYFDSCLATVQGAG